MCNYNLWCPTINYLHYEFIVPIQLHQLFVYSQCVAKYFILEYLQVRITGDVYLQITSYKKKKKMINTKQKYKDGELKNTVK